MTFNFHSAAAPLIARLAAGAIAVAAGAAQASPFELVYSGAFNSTEALNPASAASPTFFSASTPFTIAAFFDSSSPNLAPAFGGPFDGFRAYAPSSVTIDIAGAHFTIDRNLANPAAGVTVAIFDQNSFTPGRYAVGLIVDPVHDGAGIVGDFLSASPNFSANALTATTFTGFYGVGHSSGVCLSGSPPACPHAVTPLVLRDAANLAWSLALGNYDADFPVAHTPGTQLSPLNGAQIIAVAPPVPEPETYLLMLGGLGGLSWWLRRRRR